MEEDEIKNLLRKNLEISQESLKILKKINRGRVIGNFLFVLKWMIIIGLALGLFYYLEPYIKEIQNSYNQIKELKESIPNVPAKMPR